MKLKSTERFDTFTLEVDERELDTIHSALKRLLDRYPNSDPIIDLIFDIKKIKGE